MAAVYHAEIRVNIDKYGFTAVSERDKLPPLLVEHVLVASLVGVNGVRRAVAQVDPGRG